MNHIVPLSLCLLLASGAVAGSVDYGRDIQPILTRSCVECHGPKKQKSGLRLDQGVLALKGNRSGRVVVPGRSAESKLYQAITGAADVPHMPPVSKPPLPPRDVALIKKWIDQGAKVPPADVAVSVEPGLKHWAFQPPKCPTLPRLNKASWVRNPIDCFILDRLEKHSIAPAPEADRITLIRRLSLDLTGLPPAIEEVDAFVADHRPDAYERLVERFLNSPHYGERWGRHWLDAARYADSNGFNIDAPRSIWPYRDWVIHALNTDLPFDRFLIEQFAGDLLTSPTREQRVATGFHRNTLLNQEGGIDLEQFRVERVVDRVNTTGSAVLGLTIGCAQCHDHKFDPISQKEYFQLFAFFNNQEENDLPLPTPQQIDALNGMKRRIERKQHLLQGLATIFAAGQKRWEKDLTPADRSALPRRVKEVLDVPPYQRSDAEKEIVEQYLRLLDRIPQIVGGLGNALAIGGCWSRPAAGVHTANVLFRMRVESEIETIQKHKPAVVTTMVLEERRTPRMTHVHIKGDFLRPGQVVQPCVPEVLTSSGKLGKFATRLDLARWLVSPANPLTARVAVNRLWQHHFGMGLVETENDFGTQGTPPSHPELLDWLATEFIRQRWSLKAMHRLMVTSATYRQASRHRPELAAVDPNNRLWGRQNRVRLEAEIIRDVALAASGVLSLRIGGPSVFPPQPAGVFRFTQIQREWKADVGTDRFRRGMYTHFWRSAPHPALIVFDAPDSTTSCTRRNRSNTPLQALTLLNDEAFFEFARFLARRVQRACPGDDRQKIEFAFRLCLARRPTPRELEICSRLLRSRDGTGTYDTWTRMARALMNVDEFITRE